MIAKVCHAVSCPNAGGHWPKQCEAVMQATNEYKKARPQ
jgi:hypothetical protein